MIKSIKKLPIEYQDLAEYLVPYGYTSFKVIPGQGLCCLYRYMFTIAILTKLSYQDLYYGRYCYPNLLDAVNAYLTWNGEDDPSGNWIKYKGRDGERENPNYSNK